MTGRRLFMQGVRPFDLVQVALSMGLTNGGVLAREGIWKYTGAVPVMTGSGAQTPTRRQIELHPRLEGQVPDRLSRPISAHGAGGARRTRSIDPRSLGIKGLIAHLGVEDRSRLEALWGADVFDTYGCNECGTMAAECQHKSGMHLFEDAFVMEVNDLETLKPKAAGERGVVFITTLFKHAAPMIRYNMNDVTSWAERRVRLRHASAQHHQDLRPQRQHGEAARRECVSRGDRRDRLARNRAPTANMSACWKAMRSAARK